LFNHINLELILIDYSVFLLDRDLQLTAWRK